MEEKNFFDFQSGEAFNLNEEYVKLFGESDFIPKNPNETKLKDAANTIAELGSKYVEGLSLQKYETVYINLNEFLTKFKTDSEEVKNMTKEDRNKLFGYGRELFSTYQEQYAKLDFNFEVSVKEWHYIENTLTKKLSYNGQELFNYWELYMKFIKPTKDIADRLPKGVETFIPVASVQSLILMSHLLMKHEEKASTDSFHYFRTVLTEIAKMTKLFNAYGVMLERVTNRFNHWVDALNAIDGFNNVERVIDEQQQS